MEGKVSRVVRLGAGLLGLMTLGWVLIGHAAKPVLEGLPTDWTHRHIIFSQPATAELAGIVARDPRYWQQWYRQNVAHVLDDGVENSAEIATWRDRPKATSSIHRDWSEGLGNLGTVGAGNYPAKYSFSVTTASCGSAATPDFVAFSTGLTGSGTQASIVAFDNLYSGCPTGTIPSVYWAYNTGGQILTSPVFSRDGSQLAFVQTSAGAASLVLLRWKASTTETVGGPVAPTSVPPASYPGCTTPCMTTIALTSGGGTPAATNDTTSSVFYDYVGDTAWVGDAKGWLHQFTPVFSNTAAPAEIRTAPWPVQVNTTAPTALTSPVHDHVSGNVFVEDQGGFLYAVSASSGAVTTSGRLDFAPAADIVGGLVVDPSAQKVYVFASSDGTTNCTGPAPCSAVYQLATNFTGGTGSEVTVGTSSAAPNPLYDGAFDNAYQTSLNATGNIYVCGDTGVNPMLWQVPITAGTFGTALEVAPLTPVGNHRACSPVTDILNPSAAGGAPEERVFFSVTLNAHPTICANGGCALSLVNMPWQKGTTYSVGQEVLIYRIASTAFYVDVAINATPGTSGGTVPAWPAAIGNVTHDGGVTWLNQGTAVFTALANWAGGHAYAQRARIVDSNGNVEVVIVGGAGTSGGTDPAWATTAGLNTTDGTVTWVNAGVLAAAGLPATGGTSGIIIDNTVSQTTQAGASQLYFSTLGNEACPTTSTGCAVQASQTQLK
ncbi:MAG: hypothetical protein ACLQBK_04840 [Candidatus Sulfotelmatobacter sp.]